MNCKKGDLAVVIKGLSAGAVVKCLKLIPEGTWVTLPNGSQGFLSHPHWEIDRELPSKGYGGEAINMRADDSLRPIRDQPGEDETLTWAPVPHKETV